MLEPGIRVGGYTLDRHIGGGNAGQIWRARTDVFTHSPWRAVKLLEPLEEGEARRDFHREVYALARLRHPNVAHVSDVGIWHHQQRRHPFLVMEFIEGETFQALANKRVSWRVWYDLIMDVLQALAHAHAVGVVHRDIKPSNILVELDERGERMAKLVDFGIARIVRTRPGEGSMKMTAGAGRSADGVLISGTPRYMAPEQIDTRHGIIGPWTDLYALGCMIWRLLCLRGPFDGKLYQLLAAHLSKEPGRFEPVIDVPDGLEAWLRWLMQKNPHQRCRHASHAAASFAPLVRARSSTARLEPVSEWGADETSTSQSHRSVAQLQAMLDAEEGRHELSELLPEVPEQWDARKMRARVASLDTLVHPVIWRHRPRQLVGRRAERDVLWQHLRTVLEQHTPMWVNLEGAHGVGKSHLQSWFERYVRELGVAHVISLSCGHYRRAKSVVQGLIRHTLLLKGLSGDLLREEFRRFFLAMGLSEGQARLESAQYTSLFSHEEQDAQEPEELAIRLLKRICAQRPVVLSLQGLSQHPELAARLARHFASVLRDPQPLLVLTVDPTSDVLAHQRRRTFGEHFAELQLEPLAGALQQRALSSMLPLDRGSLQMLVARTNEDLPLAVMHLHKWVHEGVFAQRRQEFSLESAMLDQIAPDPRIFWSRWLDEWRGEFGDTTFMALEIAALMDEAVYEHLWGECAELIGADVGAISDRLFDLGVAKHLDAGRWMFTHELPRTLLGESAREHRRVRAHHEVIARVYERCESDDTIFAERAAEHWFEAERYDDALRVACLTGERVASRSDFAALERISAMLRDIGKVARALRERAQLYAALFEMVSALRRRDLGRAEELSVLCMAMARLNGWDELRARVRLELAVWHEHKGEFASAFDQIGLAEPVLCDWRAMSAHYEGVLGRRLLRYKAHLLVVMGRAREALHVLDELDAASEGLEGSHERALGVMTRAHALEKIGQFDEARALLQSVFVTFERAGDRMALTVAMSRHADMSIEQDPVQSKVILERVLGLLQEGEQGVAINTKLRLAMVYMKLGELGSADIMLQDVLEHVSGEELLVQHLVALLARATCAWQRGHEGLALSMASRARELLYRHPISYDRARALLDELLDMVSQDHVVLHSCLMDCRAHMSRHE